MNKIQIVFLVSLLVSTTLATQSVVLKCESVSSTVCPKEARWTVSGTNERIQLSSVTCASNGCSLGSKSFDVQACKIDYKNDVCTTGICFVKGVYDVCVNSVTCGNSSAPQTYTMNYTCGDCGTANASCSKCMFVNTTQPGVTNYNKCMGANCT